VLLQSNRSVACGHLYEATSSAPPRLRLGQAILALFLRPSSVIDYKMFCRIHDCHDRQDLTIAQTARTLGLQPKTVIKWLARSRLEQAAPRPRSSVLDPFDGRITRSLLTLPQVAQAVQQRAVRSFET
jgi:hypothetical protein